MDTQEKSEILKKLTPENIKKFGEILREEEEEKRLFFWQCLPLKTRILISMGLIENPFDK